MLKELYKDVVTNLHNTCTAETEGMNPDEAGEHFYEEVLKLLADETSEDNVVVNEYLDSIGCLNKEQQLSDDVWSGVVS